jgi:hypothetical protein
LQNGSVFVLLRHDCHDAFILSFVRSFVSESDWLARSTSIRRTEPLAYNRLVVVLIIMSTNDNHLDNNLPTAIAVLEGPQTNHHNNYCLPETTAVMVATVMDTDNNTSNGYSSAVLGEEEKGKPKDDTIDTKSTATTDLTTGSTILLPTNGPRHHHYDSLSLQEQLQRATRQGRQSVQEEREIVYRDALRRPKLEAQLQEEMRRGNENIKDFDTWVPLEVQMDQERQQIIDLQVQKVTASTTIQQQQPPQGTFGKPYQVQPYNHKQYDYSTKDYQVTEYKSVYEE